ncbi:hypothetical protein [Sinorhizobium meliloti]|uniref:hypothetical protein n=1 Tax=Rhizobium meliloti TaxID=382 RepID=UPI00299E3408|nr:hypothetical protein [Sinorhizobium meliloti]MDW9812315.1 hypothetical protein [Sinorhizobium meliloti]MDX0128316.1 hypothetical protein [Sinorhizobium meliloti]MDX0333625.1 hypothetical protein [Sinorhizobium meliloti]
MDLSRMIRATKVLVVAFALAMPAGLPARAAESDVFGNVETRTRHVRIKHRTPHHSWRKGRHRSITTIGGFSFADSRGLPDVQTRTRHVRPRYPWPRYPWHRNARRGRDRGPVIVINGGGYPSGGYDSYGSYDFPTPIPDIGTYAGGLSAFREEGNGIYFSRDGGYAYLAGETVAANPSSKRAKIIIVSPQVNASACSWEHGVCVVRP